MYCSIVQTIGHQIVIYSIRSIAGVQNVVLDDCHPLLAPSETQQAASTMQAPIAASIMTLKIAQMLSILELTHYVPLNGRHATRHNIENLKNVQSVMRLHL
jgi:hypothetical protein